MMRGILNQELSCFRLDSHYISPQIFEIVRLMSKHGGTKSIAKLKALEDKLVRKTADRAPNIMRENREMYLPTSYADWKFVAICKLINEVRDAIHSIERRL